MKKKAILGLALTAAVAVGVMSMSQAATKTTVTATGSAKGATPKAPTPFTGSFVYNAFEENPALRAANPITFEWWWDGVQIGGKGFPTCTAAQIDAAQSDAGCPKGSLVGQVTALVAELGPESDRTQKITCLGKDVRFYNSGPNSIVWFVVGPGEQCAGVTYLPPFETQLKKVGELDARDHDPAGQHPGSPCRASRVACPSCRRRTSRRRSRSRARRDRSRRRPTT